MDQNVSLAVVGVVSGMVFAYVGYLKGLKKDSYTAGASKGALETNITYIMRRTDDVLLEQRDTNKNLTALGERVTRVEESAKSAHKRLDQFEEKGGS